MDQVQILGKTIFLTKDKEGKTIPHAWDVHTPYMKDGKFHSAGPISAERNLSTGRVAKLRNKETGEEHEVQYNSLNQINKVGDEEVRPGTLDWLNE